MTDNCYNPKGMLKRITFTRYSFEKSLITLRRNILSYSTAKKVFYEYKEPYKIQITISDSFFSSIASPLLPAFAINRNENCQR